MKYFISFMFLITSVNAFAALPEPVPVPKLQGCAAAPNLDTLNKTCMNTVTESNASCIGRVKLASQAATAAPTPITPGVADPAMQTQAIAKKKFAINSDVQRACQEAYENTQEACGQAKSAADQAKMSPSVEGDTQCNITLPRNIGALEQTISRAKSTYGGIAVLTEMDASQSLVDLKSARNTEVKAVGDGSTTPVNPQEESWFQRNGAYVVGAGMLGVGALALLNNSGSKSGSQQQQNQNSSPSPSPSPTVTPAACSADSDYNNSACTDTLVTSCASATSNLCAAFTNNYCGLDDANDVTPSGSGAGNKTTFCRSKVSARFCATGNGTCATCEYLTQQSKDICKTNPTLCVAQNTPAQIAAKQAACPSDPLYADASILQGYGGNVDGSLDEPNLPSGTTSTLVSTNPSTTGTIGTPATGKNTSTGTTVFTGKYNSAISASSAGSKPGITSASAIPTGTRKPSSTGNSEYLAGGQGAYATASAYKGAASEVSDSLGRNLFDKNSKTLNIWCKSVSCRNVGAAVTN